MAKNSIKWDLLQPEDIEKWKDIDDYIGLYQISSFGRVKSVKRKDKNNHSVKEKIRKQSVDKDGYNWVKLYKNGVGKIFYIHRLVAQTFIPNPENKPCIDHINTNRTDNRVENLRWVTHKENSNNPITKQMFLQNRFKIEKCKRVNKYKLSEEVINKIAKKHKKPIGMYKDGILIKKFDSAVDAERENKEFNNVSISATCNGRLKTYRGYEWKFII